MIERNLLLKYTRHQYLYSRIETGISVIVFSRYKLLVVNKCISVTSIIPYHQYIYIYIYIYIYTPDTYLESTGTEKATAEETHERWLRCGQRRR